MKIKNCAEGVWLVADEGGPTVLNPEAVVVYHYVSGLWRCSRDGYNSGPSRCIHIRAVQEAETVKP